MIQADPLAQSESFVHTVDPHLPHESHTWLPPIVEWHALNPVAEPGLHPLYVEGRVYEVELYACSPAPQVVALVAVEVLVPLRRGSAPVPAEVAAGDNALELLLLLLLPTTEVAPGPVEVVAEKEPLDCVRAAEPESELLKAADTSELRLDASAEFVMEPTGTNDELTTDTLEMTDADTELLSDELGLGDTKLKVVPESEEDDEEA